MALLDRRDPTQFDVGGSLVKTDPSGVRHYWSGGTPMVVPEGMTPIQTHDQGNGVLSPNTLAMIGMAGIGGIAGAGGLGMLGAGGEAAGAGAAGSMAGLQAGDEAFAGAGAGAASGTSGTATGGFWPAAIRGIPGLIGAIGAHNQTQGYRGLADQFMSMGQPYRDRLAALYADPSSFLHSAEVTTPVQQGTDAMARALSVHGNPVGSGHALQELQDYSANQLFSRLGEEKNRLAGFGGLAQFNAAAPGTASGAIGSEGNLYNAIGAGAGAVFNPQPSLVDLYRAMQGLQ